MSKVYSLRKSKKILHASFALFKKKGKSLSSKDLADFENDLRELEGAIFAGNREKADLLAKKVENLSTFHFKKSFWGYVVEVGIAVVFAFVIAVVVRQVWFEPYVIPTGSMRPSFKEDDHLTVTKTTFGINVPLSPKHLYFNPDNIKRGGVVIFSADNLNMRDIDTTYFMVLPYKKRYIKRLIGKPGDTLYFYGGNIYGIDKDGNFINELLADPYMQKLEHIPFLSFEGDMSVSGKSQYTFRQASEMLGKLNFAYFGGQKGEVFYDNRWVKEDSDFSYYDFFGMKNFAMARLLTADEVEKYTDFDLSTIDQAKLYLELKHHPNLTYPDAKIEARGGYYILGEMPSYKTIIPLNDEHIDAIMDNMYTSRFMVKNGRVKKYPEGGGYSFHWPEVKDGTYEFYFGQATKVGFKGWSSPVPEGDPIYDKKNVQELFNYGVEILPIMSETYFPRRFAYFRDGDLYLLGAPILKKDDPTLLKFLEFEKKREGQKYIAFQDYGAPFNNGEIDVEKIKKFGLKVPDKHYFVLGDNHSVSADGRVFGFVPEDNMKGSPSLILWPPGDRWGLSPQTRYPLLTVPRLIVWGIAALILLLWYGYHRKKMASKLF